MCIMLDIGSSVLCIHPLFAPMLSQIYPFFFSPSFSFLKNVRRMRRERLNRTMEETNNVFLKTCTQFRGPRAAEHKRAPKCRGYARRGNACSESRLQCYQKGEALCGSIVFFFFLYPLLLISFAWCVAAQPIPNNTV